MSAIQLNRQSKASPITGVDIRRDKDPRKPSTVYLEINDFWFEAGKVLVISKPTETFMMLVGSAKEHHAVSTLLTHAGFEEVRPGKFLIN